MGRTILPVALRGALGALVALVTLAAAVPARAGPPDHRRFSRIYVIDFEDEVEPALAAYLGRSIFAARAAKADCIVFRIDSPGGRVDSAIEITDAFLAIPRDIRTVAWVP